jgi:predicted RNA-binding protein with PIN domain
LTPRAAAATMGRMDARLVIIDGYNVILRSNRLKPGDNRTLKESREKLLNLLAWMMGGNNVRFLVVFDGTAEGPGRDVTGGRVLVTYSRPPETADDVIGRYVDKWIGGDEQIVVVTSDIEVARHARALGAEVSLGDLFLASAFAEIGPAGEASGETDGKPTSLSKKEIEEWAALFKSRPRDTSAAGDASDAEDERD